MRNCFVMLPATATGAPVTEASSWPEGSPARPFREGEPLRLVHAQAELSMPPQNVIGVARPFRTLQEFRFPFGQTAAENTPHVLKSLRISHHFRRARSVGMAQPLRLPGLQPGMPPP